jgi:hydroxymethylglutaryl-CoA reductase (NADPH)
MQHNRSAPPTRSSTPAPSSGATTPVSLAITSTVEKAVRHPEQLGAPSPAAVERAKR